MRIDHYGGAEGLLQFMQERVGEVSRAVIYPPGSVVTFCGRVMTNPSRRYGILLHFPTVRRLVMGRDAARLLNDGMLTRAGVPIVFAGSDA
ncbi:MAG TPA: hypothetical protein VD866_07025 [Urbifossiella sp.]|nr:hypothetical protein [Urbifossiella sp.]